MVTKKIPRDPLRRGFIRDGFRAVLAKLGDLPIAIRAGPRAALAIEAGFFVRVEQRFESAHHSHFADRESRRLIYRRDPAGDASRFADFSAVGQFSVDINRGGFAYS